jgi:hypothetical protein
MRERLTAAVLAAALLSTAAIARADVPAWLENPCAGLDCSATPAGVGEAAILPELVISSAIAYAQAARGLSSAMDDSVSSSGRQYGEGAGQQEDSAVKGMVRSPLGTALMKSYGASGSDSDTISVAIRLQRIEDPRVRVFAQEYVDLSSGTLFVRLMLDRSGRMTPPAGFTTWPGRRILLNSQDVRVGRHDELTLWVRDEDAGLTWVEQWPFGGADLMREGEVSAKFVFDRVREEWKAAPQKLAAARP